MRTEESMKDEKAPQPEKRTEESMKDEKAPQPENIQELTDYINELVNMEHDYGTRVYAMSLASTATFNFIASKLGVTGFQASCADLDIIRRIRELKCPFAIIHADDMLYPQYNIENQASKYIDGWKSWAKKEAKKLLQKNDKDRVHPDVWKRWEKLAAYDEIQ